MNINSNSNHGVNDENDNNSSSSSSSFDEVALANMPSALTSFLHALLDENAALADMIEIVSDNAGSLPERLCESRRLWAVSFRSNSSSSRWDPHIISPAAATRSRDRERERLEASLIASPTRPKRRTSFEIDRSNDRLLSQEEAAATASSTMEALSQSLSDATSLKNARQRGRQRRAGLLSMSATAAPPTAGPTIQSASPTKQQRQAEPPRAPVRRLSGRVHSPPPPTHRGGWNDDDDESDNSEEEEELSGSLHVDFASDDPFGSAIPRNKKKRHKQAATAAAQGKHKPSEDDKAQKQSTASESPFARQGSSDSNAAPRAPQRRTSIPTSKPAHRKAGSDGGLESIRSSLESSNAALPRIPRRQRIGLVGLAFHESFSRDEASPNSNSSSIRMPRKPKRRSTKPREDEDDDDEEFHHSSDSSLPMAMVSSALRSSTSSGSNSNQSLVVDAPPASSTASTDMPRMPRRRSTSESVTSIDSSRLSDSATLSRDTPRKPERQTTEESVETQNITASPPSRSSSDIPRKPQRKLTTEAFTTERARSSDDLDYLTAALTASSRIPKKPRRQTTFPSNDDDDNDSDGSSDRSSSSDDVSMPPLLPIRNTPHRREGLQRQAGNIRLGYGFPLGSSIIHDGGGRNKVLAPQPGALRLGRERASSGGSSQRRGAGFALAEVDDDVQEKDIRLTTNSAPVPAAMDDLSNAKATSTKANKPYDMVLEDSPPSQSAKLSPPTVQKAVKKSLIRRLKNKIPRPRSLSPVRSPKNRTEDDNKKASSSSSSIRASNATERTAECSDQFESLKVSESS